MHSGKRAFDIVASSIGLVVLFPLLIVIAFTILCIDGEPVFFCQERIGYQGQLFKMWKFRTMVRNADYLGRALTIGQDARVTRTGKLLRKYKLDELPQLINVLKGEMSLVGPRPEVSRYVALYSPEQRQVLNLVPGITDPASMVYRDESSILAESADPERFYIDKIMTHKIQINMAYANHATIPGDISIIVRTLMKVLKYRG